MRTLNKKGSKELTPLATSSRAIINEIELDEEDDAISLDSDIDALSELIDPNLVNDSFNENENENENEVENENEDEDENVVLDDLFFDDEGCVVCPKDNLNCHELEEMMKITDARGEKQIAENIFSYVCCWAYDAIAQAQTDEQYNVISLYFIL